MGILELKVSTKIYDIKAITNTTYKFSDKYYIQIKHLSEDSVQVSIQAKQEGNEKLENFSNVFFNELLDQQVRITIEKDFGHIRDMIVKKAFSPINE
jgi:His-Xaa-Ser system protein HxsD